MYSNFSNINEIEQKSYEKTPFFNRYDPLAVDNANPFSISKKLSVEKTIIVIEDLIRYWGNEDFPSSLINTIARLMAIVNDLSIFEGLTYKNVQDDDEGDNELQLYLSHNKYDHCSISIYYNDKEDNDYEIFLRYAIHGQFLIKSGTIQSIGRYFNQSCEKD